MCRELRVGRSIGGKVVVRGGKVKGGLGLGGKGG